MKTTQGKVWAGTESSLQCALDAEQSVTDKVMAGDYAKDNTEDELPYLLTKQDSVGIVSIKGSLVNRDSEWNKYFGITSYNAIREAMIAAANDPEVSSIVLDIDSGGGAVNGVSDTATLIRMINDKVKPVVAFTDGTMASAAYWLGCSAGQVFAGRTALVGSIGVIATHMEYSKQLKESGVGVTVVRSGKYKALLNSVEPASKEAIAGLQSLLDVTYNVFAGHVADMRNKTMQVVEDTMAQGREFVGEAAVGASLVDGITTFDKLLSGLEAESIDTPANFIDNFKNSHQGGLMKKALTEQQIAAIAVGGQQAAVSTPVVEGSTDTVIANPEAAVASVEGQAAVVAPVEGQEAAPVEAQAAVAAPVAADAGVVAYLQAEIKEKDSAILAANVKLAQIEGEHETFKASINALMEIAGSAIGNLQVALGGTATDISAMAPLQVIAEHKRLAGEFKNKFKAGGVAAVDAAIETPVTVTIDPLHKARLAAVRSASKAK
ncbi:S49 family peptidase [Ferribacterium limneticum]|uniref:S49 family peptidase n=1 Tax=Ferribacterium limneticum TaxID=76259 RepID=UPI001CF87625|nr:S49 family peptidase [Ferribacterium limneticum]UCV26792.1 S49 family peptidase [Ferribacterium limneticum]UCV30709.1 S49 family peptidase [Ferribacterium limneticum]